MEGNRNIGEDLTNPSFLEESGLDPNSALFPLLGEMGNTITNNYIDPDIPFTMANEVPLSSQSFSLPPFPPSNMSSFNDIPPPPPPPPTRNQFRPILPQPSFSVPSFPVANTMFQNHLNTNLLPNSPQIQQPFGYSNQVSFDPFLTSTPTLNNNQYSFDPYLTNPPTRSNNQFSFDPYLTSPTLSSSRILNWSRSVPPSPSFDRFERFERIYRCDDCRAEFPTPQAYGGHMSSHSKAKKAREKMALSAKEAKRTKVAVGSSSMPAAGSRADLRIAPQGIRADPRIATQQLADPRIAAQDLVNPRTTTQGLVDPRIAATQEPVPTTVRPGVDPNAVEIANAYISEDSINS